MATTNKKSNKTNKNNNKGMEKEMKKAIKTNETKKETTTKKGKGTMKATTKQIKVNKAVEKLLPPITEKQMELLVKLGIDESEFKDLDIREASSLIRELKEKGAFEKLPPKETKEKKENKKKESGSSKKTASSSTATTSMPNISMEMANESVEKLTKYLVDFAKKDKTFEKKFKKDKMQECLNYVGCEVYKQIKDKGNNAIMIDDDDIYKLARHFFLDVYKEKDESNCFKMKFEEKPKKKEGYTQVKLAFDFE